MKRPIFAPPDSFSLSPLLALLPVRGELSKLEGLKASFFARYEKVTGLSSELDSEQNADLAARLNHERAMLKEVLTWLEVSLEEKN